MKKNAFLSVVLIIVVALGLWWLTSGTRTASYPEGEPIKIGYIGPLTGEAASYSEQVVPGIELAVKEINDAGGVNGRPIEIIFEDDQCAAQGGINGYTKLVNADKVVAILGSICSVAVEPGAPVAQAAGVPTIIWGSAPGLPRIGDYIFRTYPSDAFQGTFAAEYVYNTLGKRNVAILYVQNPWGQGLYSVFKSRFTELGGTVTIAEGLDQGATDVRTELTKVKQSNPELIYIPLYPAVGAIALQQARTLGITATFFGGDTLETSEFSSVPEADGTLYTVGKFSNPPSFITRVKDATGKESKAFTPMGYDGMKILASVIDRVGTNQEKIRDALAKLEYTDAISLPVISFDADGDLASAEFEIHVVKDGTFKKYEP